MDEKSDTVTKAGVVMEPEGTESLQNKYRVLKTVGLITGFFVLGLCVSVTGPSLVSMQVILGVNTKTISSAITGRAVGYFCGTVLSGFVYARVNKELLFSVLFAAFGALTVAAPFGRHLFYFIGMLTAQGFVYGFADAASQCYMLRLWNKHKLEPVIFQTMYTIWAVGATIGPFVITPFLADIPNELENNQSVLPIGLDNKTDRLSVLIGNLTVFIQGDVTEVRYGYVITGVVPMVTVVIFLVYLALIGCRCCSKQKRSKQVITPANATSATNKRFKIIFLVNMVLGFLLYTLLDKVTADFLATYSTQGLGWRNKYGGLVTSAYFAGHGVTKVICIYLFTVLSPRQSIYIETVISLFGNVLMLLTSLHFSVLWVAAIVAGIGISAIQACLFLLAKQYIDVSGKISSVFMASCSVGLIIGPVITGLLFDTFGARSFPYIIFVFSVLQFINFVVGDIYTQRVGKENTAKSEVTVNGDPSKSLVANTEEEKAV